jgi:hypothetical protein
MLTDTQVRELNELFVDDFYKIEQVNHNEISVNQSPQKGWDIPVSKVQIGDYLIVPLTGYKKLKSESYLMNNCVRDYRERCDIGQYYLFSIRDLNNNRLATMSMYRSNGYWYYEQCLGKDNSEDIIEETLEFIDENGKTHYQDNLKDIFYVAHDVVRLANLENSY